MSTAMINIPDTVARGEVFEIKILLQHPMETGFRPGADGRLIPRDIIREVACHYGGRQVFRADLFPAVAANPFLAFHLRATESGEIEIVWRDEQGGEFGQSVTLTVT
jgi:sulfur-oxidizing protein SoxZ